MQESDLLPVTSVVINRYHVDLTDETVSFESVQAEDLEDALGGIARATKLLDDVDVDFVRGHFNGAVYAGPMEEVRWS